MAQHLVRFEDGPAVLFTTWSKRRQLARRVSGGNDRS
jgi:hypothetical protein